MAAELLAPDRTRLYPKFETYRLRTLDPATDVTAYALPGGGATQSRVGYGAQQLSFKEVRARIAWDHLSTATSRGVYVDVDWQVVGFQLDGDLVPTFTSLGSLPVPISSSVQQSEYPRALALSPTTWAVSSGSGSLYILNVTPPSQPFTGSFIARYDLVLSSSEPEPFLLYSARLVADTTYRILLARAVVAPSVTTSIYKPRHADFDLFEVELDVGRRNGVDAVPEPLVPVWTLRGGDLPYWCAWSETGWLVLSEETFDAPKDVDDEPKAETEEERIKREHDEKVAKLGLGASLADDEVAAVQALEATATDSSMMEVDDDNDKVYPYSWTQDGTSLSVTFTVPAGTSRSDLSVSLSAMSLSLAIYSAATAPPLSTFLSKRERPFWTDIVVADSTWTFDAASSTLTLELQKVDENTRWPSVFSPSDDDDEDNDEDEVPETLSPSTLAAIRESFNNVRTRAADEPAGNHPAMPALLREEMEMDLDDGEDYGERSEGAFADLGVGTTVGRSALFGYVVPTANGARAAWPRQPASVLSLPLESGSSSSPTGLIVKSAVDGLLFSPPSGLDPTRAPWTHLGTNPALAFVMSSKRDLRLVRHVMRGSTAGRVSSTVLAFDSGSGTGQGNVYIYYPPGNEENTARQGVVGVSGGERGALLGVGCISVAGKEVVVALCERVLVVLGGVL